MIIIDRNDLEKYRYSVAKYVFLKKYKEFIFVSDFFGTNCMLTKYKNRKIVVSLFGKPQISKKQNYEIIVFKQKNSTNSEKLSKEFNSLFGELIIEALISPSFLIRVVGESPLFKPLIIDLHSVHPLEGNVFKHYGEIIKFNDSFDRIKGNITFANPNTFNDPFDCKCIYPITPIIDKFRVFCSTPINNNILMWSHYSSEHKGYCFEYTKFSIVKEMINAPIDGIGIIGNVRYSKARPKTRPNKTKVSYTDLKFYIDATFTKFSGWSYEKEYRFVLISDYFDSSNPYYNLTVPVVNAFVGCNGTLSPLINKKTVLRVKQLNMSAVDYSLR